MPPALKDPTDTSVSGFLAWARTIFRDREIDSPRLTAEILLAHSLGVRRIDLYIRPDRIPDRKTRFIFLSLVERRLCREPVAYITGAKEFWSLPLCVSPGVLIPRPETEHLVAIALALMDEGDRHRPWRILDLGTGSGAIILAMAHERPHHVFFASDESAEALAVSRQNARSLKLEHRIRFFRADWLTSLKKTGARLNLILSNPPYIATETLATLQPEIRRYEPRQALDGGDDGLNAIRTVLHSASEHLIPGGHLLLEIGWDQKKALEQLSSELREMDHPRFHKDFGGHDRIMHLRKKQGCGSRRCNDPGGRG